jgi:methylmalonyl-CoA mutase N-terminal domain/subunit
LKFTTDAVEFCVKNLPNWAPLQISGEHIVSMGARNIEGVAFALADAIQYLECALERGLNIDEVASKNEFLVSARGEALLEDVAKFRAIRKLWAEILKERFGAQNPNSLKMNIIGFGSGTSLTRQEPLNNIVRTTLQCLVLALSGVPSINLPSYDEALSTPSQEAARIALRTQQIVAYEAGIADTADPLGGSFFLEYLTKEIEKKAKDIIKKIDDLGKAAAAIEQGFYERMINRGIYEHEKEMESGQKVQVGVNKFQTGELISIKAFKGNPEEEEKQKARLKEVKRRRNSRAVMENMSRLKGKAKKDENLVKPILDCVREYATLGEIFDTLREVWGDWKARPSLRMD